MKANRGAALLLVVLLVSLLAVLVVEFQRQARVELRSAGNLRDSVQAAATLRSGASVASALLVEELEGDEGVDHRGEEWFQPQFVPLPLGAVTVAGRLVDLDGRFPLGALLDGSGRAVPARVAAYRRLLELTAPEGTDLDLLIEALVDWTDGDQDGPQEDPPYTPPNLPLERLDDLQKVEGYTPEVLAAILPHLDTRAEKAVNVNTATAPVLTAMHPDLTRGLAEELFEELGEEPLTRAADFKSRPVLAGLAPGQWALDPAVESRRFLLGLRASVHGVERRGEAVLERDRGEKKVRLVSWREE